MRDTTAERFEKYTHRTEGCWWWQGTRSRGGHAMLHVSGKGTMPALRWYMVYRHGRNCSGLDLHHTCRNPECVNPDHIEFLSRKEHRAIHPRRNYALKTHCACGREFDYRMPSGRAVCRECRARRERKAYHRKKTT